jgi:hypothetical protein
LWGITVGSAVGDKYSDLWNSWPSTLACAKHCYASDVESIGNIGFASIDVQTADGGGEVGGIAVRV